MKRLKILVVCLMVAALPKNSFAKEIPMKQIRSYMSWSAPVDPAKIITIADMDLSYSLASTLVERDENKQFRKGLADRWEIIGDRTFRFTLRDGLKWSDGALLKCEDVKSSLERGMKEYPDELRSLSNMLSTITCNDNHIDFLLKVPAKESNLLGKLTEPNYGVVKIDHDGVLLLSASTGPFFVANETPAEIKLLKNKNWFSSTDDMADEVILRKFKNNMNPQLVLKDDSWANLTEASSLMDDSLLANYKQSGFAVWTRPIDKVYLMRMSKRLENNTGHELFKYLRQTLSRETILQGLSGYSLGEQMFPVGYQLHDPDFPKEVTKATLPAEFKKRPLEILFSRARNSKTFEDNLSKAVKQAVGLAPKFIDCDLSDQTNKILEGNFDIVIGTMGLADPDPEGVLSYYIENSPPVIPKSDGVFLKRLDQARHQPDLIKRVIEFRKILTDATVRGYVIPLFHLSTVGIGRSELDLSQIPQSEESVTLSKVRFKSVK